MTKTVEAIDKEVAELLEMRKLVLDTERKEAITTVKSLIKKYDIKLSELGSMVKGKTALKAKYFNPDDKSEKWSGAGRSPNWFKSYKDAGKDLSLITL